MNYSNAVLYTVKELIEKLQEYPEWYSVENVLKVDSTSNQSVTLFEEPEDKYSQGYDDGYSDGYDEGRSDGYDEGRSDERNNDD